MSSPIYVALDTPDLEKAKAVAARVRNHVGGIKLGLEFFSANGRQGIREMAELDLPIFLDLKFHDIPNTVGKAIQAASPTILTHRSSALRNSLKKPASTASSAPATRSPPPRRSGRTASSSSRASVPPAATAPIRSAS